MPENYEQETIEQLEERFAKGEGEVQAPDEPEQPEQPVQESAPEEQPEEASAEPADEEPQADQPDSEPQEEPEVQAEAEPSVDPMEEMRLRLELEATERQKFQTLFGNSQNQIGELRRSIDALRGAQVQRPSQPPEGDFDQPQYPQQPPAQTWQQPVADPNAQRLDQLEELQRQQAIQAAYADFAQKHGSELDDTSRTELAKNVEQEIKQYEGFETTPASAGRLASMILQTAYTKVRLAQIERLRTEAKSKKATQVAKSRQVKKAASSGGGASSAKPKTKTPEDMTAEEADKELIRLYGDGRGRIRRFR